MAVSRRRFLGGTAGAAGLYLISPVLARAGRAVGIGVDPALANRRRLVVIFLGGGNDGLNTVVPVADVAGAARASVYRKLRPSLGYAPEQTLRLDRAADAGHGLGLSPSLPYLHGLYRDGRVALVQGVDYPNHSYSHFSSTEIWHTGEPERSVSGWVGRHLDRAGASEGEVRAVGIGNGLPVILRGDSRQGLGIVNIPSTKFADGADNDVNAKARHDALAGFGGHPEAEALRALHGRTSGATVGLVRNLAETKVPAATGSALADKLVTARLLLEEDIGTEVVYLEHSGFDTHANQRAQQERLLAELDAGLGMFWTGKLGTKQVMEPMSPHLTDRTMVMTLSEFGRRIGENGTGAGSGTDHGAASPMFLIGPPAAASPLVGGVHGDHPDMGTVALPADNLVMTTDLRRVYESVLTNWLHNPDPLYSRYAPLPGLFR
ncbi:MAG TPA: DUF1501 domain-containing protein [Acidimicrobiales bacterium]|nr:DUF1501 domain-containing protein [Acidimicrobiales bacterium]